MSNNNLVLNRFFTQYVFSDLVTNHTNSTYCTVVKRYLKDEQGKKNSEVIIEKETGLFLKSNAPEDTVEREYTFNNIEDSIFAEPDISQYKIKEK